MIKRVSVALLISAFSLSGCVVVAPYNQTPAELKADPAKFREQVSYPMDFEKFLQAAYLTQTNCGDALTFVVAPYHSSALAMLSVAVLSSTATVALAEARPDGSGTVVKVWAQNNGWATAYLRALRQIDTPPRCHS